ncbi:terminase small subunit [Paracoccus angustae]|uniref:Terminase small subunit n=1 Tax=Paracoccus angustae TaxID=1671480 RepID=A0ABV7TZT3_9RHOB
MAAPKGNRFWEARSSHGANPRFAEASDLWDACLEYFEWVERNPLQEAKVVQSAGKPKVMALAKMRAMTITGLCVFLDIVEETWRDWRKNRNDLSAVIARVEQIIRTQKFEGAAAELLNPNIIARDLGLADKSELSGRDGGPIQTEDVSARDILASRLSRLTAGKGTADDPGGSD